MLPLKGKLAIILLSLGNGDPIKSILGLLSVILSVKATEPNTSKFLPLKLKVGSLTTPVQFILFTAALSISIFTVCPEEVNELESKNTLSPELGGQPTGFPPEVNDHSFPSLQSPVPPTQ